MGAVYHTNLVAAWVGLLFGFGSGLALGLGFHREAWLGGYASLQRRLYRLAHISLFGLGVVNLCFYLTARSLAGPARGLDTASLAFIIGAITMPICCVLMAHFPRVRLLFGVPVLSLLLGGVLVVAALYSQPAAAGVRPSSGAAMSAGHLASERNSPHDL